jgi:hypothetical protein
MIKKVFVCLLLISSIPVFAFHGGADGTDPKLSQDFSLIVVGKADSTDGGKGPR